MLRRIASVLLMVVCASCAPVTIDLTHAPRACTEADTRPDKRPGYPEPWADAFDPGTSGVDLMFTYAPEGGANNRVIVHQIRAGITVWKLDPDTGKCEDAAGIPVDREVERFHTPARDVHWHFRAPGQERRIMNAVGTVGLAEHPGGGAPPFPRIDPDQTATDLKPWLDALDPNDKAVFLAKLNRAQFAQYEYTWEYDNCPGTTPRHKMKIAFWDVENGNKKGRSKTVTFDSADNAACEVME